jgi:hypothetical protein
VADVRRTIDGLGRLDDRLRAFEQDTKTSAGGLTQRLQAIPAARARDYAYARSLLRLPTFDLPTLGPQLVSDMVATQVGELLYWVQMAEKYLPPGIKRQLKPGPKRLRAAGTDVLFSKERAYPDFLMALAELSLAIGGEGPAAGDYAARVTGVTTQPALHGAPTRFAVSRANAAQGPSDVDIGGLLDHRTLPVRDSVRAAVSGIALPTLRLGGLGASVALGNGFTDLRFERSGGMLEGRWRWRGEKCISKPLKGSV